MIYSLYTTGCVTETPSDGIALRKGVLSADHKGLGKTLKDLKELAVSICFSEQSFIGLLSSAVVIVCTISK